MKYSIQKEEKYTVFRLDEEKLDTTMAPQVKSEMVTLNAEGVHNLIMDLQKVKYIDSSGLSAILVGNRLFKEQNGAFVMTRVNDHVLKLIKISQLDSVLDILPSVEEAVDAVFMSDLENDLNSEENEQS
jgi:anti-anti-sigma factor